MIAKPNREQLKEFENWFLRYGLAKEGRRLMEDYRYSPSGERRLIWGVILGIVSRVYRKGFADGFAKKARENIEL